MVLTHTVSTEGLEKVNRTVQDQSPTAPDRRRAAMIAAMRRSMVLRGYAATSLDHIIAEVGGSRRNIYTAFGDKTGLLRAVIETVVGEIVEESFAADAADPRAFLVDMGTRFVTRMLDPEVIELFRVLTTANGAHDASVDRLWTAGPDRFRNLLGDWLRDRVAEGKLDVPDVDFAAEILPEMMRGSLQLELLAGRRSTIAQGDITRQVEGAVDLFLRATTPK